MRGVGQIDAIESVTFRHVERNEGEKIGVKRGFRTFYGAKLLKKQGGQTDRPVRKIHSTVKETGRRTRRCFAPGSISRKPRDGGE